MEWGDVGPLDPAPQFPGTLALLSGLHTGRPPPARPARGASELQTWLRNCWGSPWGLGIQALAPVGADSGRPHPRPRSAFPLSSPAGSCSSQ